MFNKHYEQQLQNLRELAREFARVHPAIAPMLSGPSPDPDVERLLEGVAFQTGLLQQKLEDEFPEIIHGLTDIIFPHYLRPIPSASIVAFTPRPSLKESITVPAGTSLASVPIEGTRCLFSTCYDIEVHPLQLVSAEFLPRSDRVGTVRLELDLLGIGLSQWDPGGLVFYLGDDYPQAADLFFLLTCYMKDITVRPLQGGQPCRLPAESLVRPGFDLQNNLLPFPANSFSGFRLMQEYFILPQKFLFVELKGWEHWHERGEGSRFEILFELDRSPLPPPRIGENSFTPFAVPVINLFPFESDPIRLDPRIEKILVRPSTKKREHFQVFSVDQVTGFRQGSMTKKEYSPLERFPLRQKDHSVYQIIRTNSAVDNSSETYLALSYAEEPESEQETLSISLTCTNGSLPERLQLGDIKLQTSDSPGLLEFVNILPPTPPVDPPLGKNTLWRLLSHVSLNLMPLADAENLKDLLKLYIFPEGRNRSAIAANLKRVEGIGGFTVSPVNRIVGGIMMRGQRASLSARQDFFASTGDLCLFGSVLELFLGVYASLNTFVQFELIDSISGETFTWPVRIGERTLT